LASRPATGCPGAVAREPETGGEPETAGGGPAEQEVTSVIAAVATAVAMTRTVAAGRFRDVIASIVRCPGARAALPRPACRRWLMDVREQATIRSDDQYLSFYLLFG
jgi:hypothetical protein